MNLHALQLAETHTEQTLPSHQKNNYFLKALQHIHYGSITVITPENARLVFAGAKPGPNAHLHLQDWQVFDDLIARGEIGFAEAYINKRCDSSNLPELLTFALVNTDSLEKFFHGNPWQAILLRFKNFLRSNTLKGSKRNITAHYDLGNDFYSLWLDESMTYSCGLFEGKKNRTLEAAQHAKYHRILNKLNANPGDHVLEIGCGWGGFAIEAARKGLRVTALTISDKQAELARKRIISAGMQDLVSIELTDYREIEGTFDHIVSIGMFEHVGEAFWPVYFNTIRKKLKPDGKAMVQSITLDDYLFEKLHGVTGFIEHYIFPGGMLPSRKRFREEVAKAGLECKETFTFGQDYALTVRHWLSRFEAHLPQVMALGYDETFIRIWKFYLASCIASFSSHRTSVMQAEIMHPAI